MIMLQDALTSVNRLWENLSFDSFTVRKKSAVHLSGGHIAGVDIWCDLSQCRQLFGNCCLAIIRAAVIFNLYPGIVNASARDFLQSPVFVCSNSG